MNTFSQFNIKTNTSKGFEGEKIKISKILNREIVVHEYKIEESKFKDKGSGKCLYLQISVKEIKHIVFTSSGCLMESIKQVPQNGFPFQTTIIEENERFMFT